MVSSNDVTITAFRDGSMSLNGFALDSEEVAALRAHFVAERMPEDVKELVKEANRIGSRTPRIAYDAEHRAFIRALADALKAAYSQTGTDDGPR